MSLLKYAIGGVIVVAALIWGTMAFLNTSYQYVSIQQASQSHRTVQVMGKIDFGKMSYDADASQLHFVIYDAEAQDMKSAERLPVVYHGVVPGNFEQATSVVVKGMPDSTGTFVADQMFIKCPSKYQGEGDDGYQDMRKHEEATV